jgi:DNA-binding XRE family transcriptional regulator
MIANIWERFWLWRRREKLSQYAVARLLGCSRGSVQRMETAGTWPQRYIEEWKLPELLSPGEEVRLMRRRAHIEAEHMARLLDVSRRTLYHIENNEVSLSEYEIESIKKTMEYYDKAGLWPDGIER